MDLSTATCPEDCSADCNVMYLTQEEMLFPSIIINPTLDSLPRGHRDSRECGVVRHPNGLQSGRDFLWVN